MEPTTSDERKTEASTATPNSPVSWSGKNSCYRWIKICQNEKDPFDISDIAHSGNLFAELNRVFGSRPKLLRNKKMIFTVKAMVFVIVDFGETSEISNNPTITFILHAENIANVSMMIPLLLSEKLRIISHTNAQTRFRPIPGLHLVFACTKMRVENRKNQSVITLIQEEKQPSFALQELRAFADEKDGAMPLYTTPNDAQFPVEEDRTDRKRKKPEPPDTSLLKHEPPIYDKKRKIQAPSTLQQKFSKALIDTTTIQDIVENHRKKQLDLILKDDHLLMFQDELPESNMKKSHNELHANAIDTNFVESAGATTDLPSFSEDAVHFDMLAQRSP